MNEYLTKQSSDGQVELPDRSVSLKALFEVLTQCWGIYIVEDKVMLPPDADEPTDDPAVEWLRLRWATAEGWIFSMAFDGNCNPTVNASGVIKLVTVEGDICEIIPLKCWDDAFSHNETEP